MTETESLSQFATYTRVPSGLTASPSIERTPVTIVATTVLVVVSMTETVPSKSLAT